MALFQRIIDEHPQNRPAAALAQLQIGLCHELRGLIEGEKAEKAFLHWENRAERLLSVQHGADEDALAFEHVPLTKVGSIRVRYKTAQPLKPRRFTVEDDVE